MGSPPQIDRNRADLGSYMLESADLGCRADLGSFIRICADLVKIPKNIQYIT